MTFHWQEMLKTSKERHGTKKCSKLNYAKYKTFDKQRKKVRFKDEYDFDPKMVTITKKRSFDASITVPREPTMCGTSHINIIQFRVKYITCHSVVAYLKISINKRRPVRVLRTARNSTAGPARKPYECINKHMVAGQ